MAQLPAWWQYIIAAAMGYISAGAEAAEQGGLGCHMANRA